LTLVHKLQRLSGAPIVLLFGERLSAGRGYRIHLRELPQPLPGDPVSAATMINQALESLIALAPMQYLWAYNRYKTP
jgi:KDO2-lipid IV(A) lauroyltransferase